MKLRKGYYWVQLVDIAYNGQIVVQDEMTVGEYDSKDETWAICDCYEILYTLDLRKHDNGETYIQPVKRIEDYAEQ